MGIFGKIKSWYNKKNKKMNYLSESHNASLGGILHRKSLDSDNKVSNLGNCLKSVKFADFVVVRERPRTLESEKGMLFYSNKDIRRFKRQSKSNYEKKFDLQSLYTSIMEDDIIINTCRVAFSSRQKRHVLTSVERNCIVPRRA